MLGNGTRFDYVCDVKKSIQFCGFVANKKRLRNDIGPGTGVVSISSLCDGAKPQS